MPSIKSLALALAASATLASASDVAVLGQDTFNDFVAENSLVLAEFYAPWCGHCKALAPEYEEAATALKEKNIALAKVDCTEEADLCKEFGVEGYPTLKIFRGRDNVSSYSGQRKAPGIISYMSKQGLPAISIVDWSDLDTFKAQDNVAVIAYIDLKDAASNATITGLAETFRDDYLFGAVHDADRAKADGVKQPAVVVYKKFDDGKEIHTGPFETDAITSFVKSASMPLVGEVGPETYAAYMAADLPLAYIFAETDEERTKLANELKPIAKKHKGKLNMATIDAEKFGAHSENLNLKNGPWPAFAVQDIAKSLKYPFSQDEKITYKAIEKFVDDFLAGKIEPSIKSEPIPEKQDGPVQVVVAKNYKEIVLDNENDVLLEFYAPWCGHCKALAPKYEELAEMYPSDSKVVIAKVDATLNDVPDEVQGFPTIKLYPAGSKSEPLTYGGSRTIEDLAAFVKENGKYKYDAYLNETEDGEVEGEDVPLAEGMGKAARAATDKVKSKAGDAAAAAKTVVADMLDEGEHDEL